MIVEQNLIDKKTFLDLFQKRFFSFCEKSPLFLRFTLMDDRVLVYNLSEKPDAEPIEFKFDFLKDEKNNIKIIKDYLVENDYPVLEVVEEHQREPTAFEIQDVMQREKISFAKASLKLTNKISISHYRVEKVLHSSNNVIIRDMQTDELFIYKVKIPLTIFVRELFINKPNAVDIFKNKCERVKQVIDKKS